MKAEELSISELAESAGLSRRAVRFYVQQQLLPPPTGLGRGRHYNASHVERLRKIADLQAAGHSLEAIGRILAGQAVAAPREPARRPPRAGLSSELWTRLKMMEGVELHFNAARHQPTVEKLLALRESVRQAFEVGQMDEDGDAADG